jgi:hypothetical protein
MSGTLNMGGYVEEDRQCRRGRSRKRKSKGCSTIRHYSTAAKKPRLCCSSASLGLLTPVIKRKAPPSTVRIYDLAKHCIRKSFNSHGLIRQLQGRY